MNLEILQQLQEITKAIEGNCIDSRPTTGEPRVVELGFMQLRDKLDNINDAIGRSNDSLEIIARALWLIAETVEKRM